MVKGCLELQIGCSPIENCHIVVVQREIGVIRWLFSTLGSKLIENLLCCERNFEGVFGAFNNIDLGVEVHQGEPIVFLGDLFIIWRLYESALVQWLPLFHLSLCFKFLISRETYLFSERFIIFDLLNRIILLRIFIVRASTLIYGLMFKIRVYPGMISILLWVTSLFFWEHLVSKLKVSVFIGSYPMRWWRQIFNLDLVNFRLFTQRTSFSKRLRFMRQIITVIVHHFWGNFIILLYYTLRIFDLFLWEIRRSCIASILGACVLLKNYVSFSKSSSASQWILFYDLLVLLLQSFDDISKLISSNDTAAWLIGPPSSLTSDTANCTLPHKWCNCLLPFEYIVSSLLNPTRLSLQHLLCLLFSFNN